SEKQQPKQKVGEQHACSGGGGALPQQACAGCQGDEGAKISQYLACGHTLGYWLPYRAEIALDQAQDSEGNHGRCKDQMPDARDAHCLSLRNCRLAAFEHSRPGHELPLLAACGARTNTAARWLTSPEADQVNSSFEGLLSGATVNREIIQPGPG